MTENTEKNTTYTGEQRKTQALFPDAFDLVVVGAGHAGCEAALAAARLGLATLLLTSNVDRIGHLSCNPAIGGLGKGHMVREIDALGGAMGRWADEAGIQFRTLNAGKGPAVRATRAQMDREIYSAAARRDIFAQKNLWVFQDMAVAPLLEKGRVAGVTSALGRKFPARAVLLTTGTFLNGRIHIGPMQEGAGRMGDAPATALSQALAEAGVSLGRLMTCTTPRILQNSIDFSRLEEQPGDTPLPRFSFTGPGPALPQLSCWLGWTNSQSHEIIRKALPLSPMYNGAIPGPGPRYCPSIEDKIARFPDKERHQIFVEPEGLNSPEYYPNGMPTGLPLDVQEAFLHSIPGLENSVILRPGYAIEYDFVPPTQLAPWLELKQLPGLWCAGQINGSSGYEEAAAQGLWAALNIFCSLNGAEPFLPGRDQAYMAVLVDDLVSKGTDEPYRMFTSRAEHRLLLRESNADSRLTPLGRKLGLVDDARWAAYCQKEAGLNELLAGLEGRRITPDAPTRDILSALGESVPNKSISLAELLRRPGMTTQKLLPFWPELETFSPEVLLEAETTLRYAGYLQRQTELASRLGELEGVKLPRLDYAAIPGLSREVVEKLQPLQPQTLGQAARVSGITPAALGCIEVYLKKRGEEARLGSQLAP